ncbi:ogr/Delta-like zinc finger family protein, partial [Escherichia coli]|uniref:ogr/Delta-like zinc finger family protein n=1 Tax=Escherichia coli TaxID=562 RepID=UPI003CE4BC8B
MIYCPSCGHVAHTRRAHFMDDGTKIMIAQCRNIYCSATFEASESFFSDCKDSGMEYISGRQRYRDSLTSASGSAYFHERRSLNNFHRDRVITFEQIAE